MNMSNSTKGGFIPLIIIGAFVLFGIMIFSMVYGAFQQDVNLVRPDYYAEEIKYESRIQEIKRANKLGKSLSIKYIPANKLLQVQLPTEFENTSVQGEYWFFRPSNANLDFKVPIQLSESNLQNLNLEKLQKGRWAVELLFSYKNEKYFKNYDFDVK